PAARPVRGDQGLARRRYWGRLSSAAPSRSSMPPQPHAATSRQAPAAQPGTPYPLGATPGPDGTNFAVASAADGVLLCLFDADGNETRIPLQERDGDVWHGFLPGVGPGQAYGYRAIGPYDPRRGVRCNPAKLRLDPYAR